MAMKYERLAEPEEPQEPEEPVGSEQPELRMVLLGKTGVGKSATGNTILGKEEAFASTPSLFSVTSACQKETGEFDGKKLIVVDTPGLFEMSNPEEEINRAISFTAPGMHVFLVVIQLNIFTDEDQVTLKIIQKMFGKTVARYIMVLFSHGDDLEMYKKPIDDFINGNPALVDFIRQCGGRYHVFNNRKKDPSQVRELLKKINTMVQRNEGRCYTNEMFIEAGIRMVLLGKTGAGKSATGNTILGESVFESQPYSCTVTLECERKIGLFDREKLVVIDTPGLFDTNKSEKEVKIELSRCISLAAPGPHVFLVVVQAGRFTEEEQKTVKIIQEMFGEKAPCYTLVLFTRGDDLEAHKTTTDKLIEGNSALSNFIRQCDGGHHVFNNRKNDPSQVRELLEKINTMVQNNGGSYYTNDMFKEAGKAKSKAEADLRIAVVGKIRVGKSASGNTILSGAAFTSRSSPSAVTSKCQKETALVAFKTLAVVDTPGLFNTELTVGTVKKEINRFISLAAPGPHVFLVVIQSNNFTTREEETVKIIQEFFGKEAERYTMALITHGDDVVEDGTTTDQLADENPALSGFITQCGGRYHVFNNKKEDPSQVRELLEKINVMVQKNGGSHYTNKMFKEAEEAINKEMTRLKKEYKNMTDNEIRYKAERKNEFTQQGWFNVIARATSGVTAGVGVGTAAVGVGVGIGIEVAVAGAIGAVGGPVGAAVGVVVGAGVGVGVAVVSLRKQLNRCVTQ